MSTPDNAARTVAVLAFDDMALLDFAGPHEVFSTAGRLTGARGEQPAFAVLTVGLTAGTASAAGGPVLLTDHGLDDCPATDLLVVPGGPGVTALLDDERLRAWLRERAAEVEALLSVGVGSELLGAAGLLRRRPATTHHDAHDSLRDVSPSTVVIGQRFMWSGQRLWTAAGSSAGVDLALHLVRQLAGEATHDATVAALEWRWRS